MDRMPDEADLTCPGRQYCTLLGPPVMIILAWPPNNDPPVLAATDDQAPLIADCESRDAAVVAAPVSPYLAALHQIPEGEQAASAPHHGSKVAGSFCPDTG
jgi:hypothetical protein